MIKSINHKLTILWQYTNIVLISESSIDTPTTTGQVLIADPETFMLL